VVGVVEAQRACEFHRLSFVGFAMEDDERVVESTGLVRISGSRSTLKQ
jgi:hypothetical protein